MSKYVYNEAGFNKNMIHITILFTEQRINIYLILKLQKMLHRRLLLNC